MTHMRIDNAVVAAGTDAASATPLSVGWSRVTSVAAGTGVRLPPARSGLECLVLRNDGTDNDLHLYPAPGDGISQGNGGAVLAGRSDASSAVRLNCIQAGVWDIISVDGTLTWVGVETLAGAAALSASLAQITAASAVLGGSGAISVVPGFIHPKLTYGNAIVRGNGSLAASLAQQYVSNPAATAASGGLTACAMGGSP